jgi:response regulator NasT
MRVCVFEQQGSLTAQLLRILTENGIKGDVVKTIRLSLIDEYDVIIFSERHEIPSLYTTIEQLVLSKKIHVVFISETHSLGKIHKLMNDFRFHRINKLLMNAELPMLLTTIQKYSTYIMSIEQKTIETQQLLTELELISKAKFYLMDRGMSEKEAHMYIRKKAMDLRKTKSSVANLIIQNRIDI